MGSFLSPSPSSEDEGRAFVSGAHALRARCGLWTKGSRDGLTRARVDGQVGPDVD
jgi:hypothetical protein